jgi:cyclic pyranopterin phosphate synthase
MVRMGGMSLSHVDPESNQPGMVPVGEKAITLRRAVAEGWIRLTPKIMEQLEGGEITSKKGPVFQTAIIAGTLAAKRTWELIPFCHPLTIEGIQVRVEPADDCRVRVECRVEVTGKTGVEMEALTGTSVAALTIYDMCKAMSHEIEILNVRLLGKTGGKSDFKR